MSRAWESVLWLGVSLTVVACGADSIELHVDVRTDLVAGSDFAYVQAELAALGGESLAIVELTADPTVAWREGERIATFPIASPGTYVVHAALVSAPGAIVLSRDVRVRITDTTGIVIQFSRDCLGVTCPGAGDPATHTECHRGRCVTPECLDDDPVSCGAPPACSWDPIAGGDHCGEDWVPADGAEIAGVHVGIGRFEVPVGTTVRVYPIDDAGQGGALRVDANEIAIAGTLDATASGHLGGNGGTAAGSGEVYCGAGGSSGASGRGDHAGSGGGFGSGHGGDAADDPGCCDAYGGDGSGGQRGGYAAAGTNGDTSLDDSVAIGSGGGGGGGGGAGSNCGNNHAYPAGAGGGGGAGGRGGGSVALVAPMIVVSGEVRTVGAGGAGRGGNGEMLVAPCSRNDTPAGGGGGSATVAGDGSGGSRSCQTVRCTVDGDGVTNTCGGNGGRGGIGAGGGVLLSGMNVEVSGRVDARGGNDTMENGGTIKISACDHVPGTYEAGRVIEIAYPGCTL